MPKQERATIPGVSTNSVWRSGSFRSAFSETGLLFTVAVAGSETGAAVAAGDKVGALSDVRAWVNKMPGPGAQAALHVTGLITAPTPCHQANVEAAAGSTAADFRVAVTLEDPPAGSMCVGATTS